MLCGWTVTSNVYRSFHLDKANWISKVTVDLRCHIADGLDEVRVHDDTSEILLIESEVYRRE